MLAATQRETEPTAAEGRSDSSAPPPCAPGPAVALAVLHHARSRRFLLRSAASAPGRAAPKSGCSGARWSPGRERRQHPESQQLALFSLGTVVRVCTYTMSGLKKKEKRSLLEERSSSSVSQKPKQLPSGKRDWRTSAVRRQFGSPFAEAETTDPGKTSH